jgi:hypothetical protein
MADEIAAVFAFLASDEASYIIGQGCVRLRPADALSGIPDVVDIGRIAKPPAAQGQRQKQSGCHQQPSRRLGHSSDRQGGSPA